MPAGLSLLSTGLIVLSLCAIACGSVGNKPAGEHLASGNTYLAKKQYNEAIIEYRVAVQKEPNLARARHSVFCVALRQWPAASS